MTCTLHRILKSRGPKKLVQVIYIFDTKRPNVTLIYISILILHSLIYFNFIILHPTHLHYSHPTSYASTLLFSPYILLIYFNFIILHPTHLLYYFHPTSYSSTLILPFYILLIYFNIIILHPTHLLYYSHSKSYTSTLLFSSSDRFHNSTLCLTHSSSASNLKYLLSNFGIIMNLSP